MNYLLGILPFFLLIGAYYVLISRKTTRNESFAFVLAIVALIPLWDGGLLLFREHGRSEQGRVAPGVVVGKLSSTGENGSRTIGGSRRSRTSRGVPALVTSHGFAYHDVLARMILTGSMDAWFIEYRYPCEASRGCFQREEVRYDLWSELRPGERVNVRTAKYQDDSGRLDGNPRWGTALAKVGIGGTLGLLAGVLSGRGKVRRRKFSAAAGVVTAVEPVGGGDKVHWRVHFAYLSSDGIARESSDEVYVGGLQSGDDCTAVYPVEAPDLGTLRVGERRGEVSAPR